MNLKSGKNLIQTVLFFLFLRFTYFYHGRHIYREKKRDRWLQVSILNYLLNCLFNSCGKSDGGREMDTHTHTGKREREKGKTTESLPKCSQQPGLDEAKARTQEMHNRWQGPEHLGHFCRLSRKLAQKHSSRGLNQHPNMGLLPFYSQWHGLA